MATPQKNKEHIIKNQTSITYIERELQQIKNQLNEVQSASYKFELNSLPSLQTTLQNIENRLTHLETNRDAKLSRHDKTALYGSLLTLLGLVAVEIIRALL